MKYGFIAEQCGQHSVTMVCRVLAVKPGSYYAWRRRGKSARRMSDQDLAARVKAIFVRHQRRYGATRIEKELREAGIRTSRKRVRRLMAEQKLVTRVTKRFKRTTKRNPRSIASPDLVLRRFTAQRPMQLLTGDITYVWTREGWLYLAIVLDVFSRRIVGWATSSRIDADLVCAAMRRALCGRVVGEDAIFHSDRGSQYTSGAFRALLKLAGIRQSMGVSCYDNAVTETVFHTIKTEAVAFEHYRTRKDAHRNLFDYIELYYNRVRRHSAIGYLAPAVFESRSITH